MMTGFRLGDDGVCDVQTAVIGVDLTRFRFVGCYPPYFQGAMSGGVNPFCYDDARVQFDCPTGKCGGNPFTVGGNPITFDGGVKFQIETDIAPAGGELKFVRTYASSGWNDFGSGGKTYDLGFQWRHNYERAVVEVTGGTTGRANAYVIRGDRPAHVFYKSSGAWISVTEGYTATLTDTRDGSGVVTSWTFISADGIETYDASGRLQAIALANGRSLAMAYTNGHLTTVTDDSGRALTLVYDAEGALSTVTEPGGALHRYERSFGKLVKVTRPDLTYRTYLYEDANMPVGLTGIVGENGVRLSTYTYSAGYAASTELAGGVQKYIRNWGNGNVTDPLGNVRVIPLGFMSDVWRVSRVDQPCPGCNLDPAQNFLGYDANGNLTAENDFNRKKTCYAYDTARNLETARVEGLGFFDNCTTQLAASPLAAPARKISKAWHASWKMEKRIAEPLRITTYAFNGDPGVSCSSGSAATALVCSKTIQATTDNDGSTGFAATADGPSRTWSYTYDAIGRLLTADGPRSDVTDTTTYTYYTSNDGGGAYRIGDLATTTNAKGHVTQFTHYDAWGRLKRVVDPNGLETLMDYWPRGWLKTRSVGTSGSGYETTSFEYDDLGQLKKVISPDATFVTYTYDDAQRLTDVQDGFGNKIHYTLDNAGNRLSEETFDPQSVLARKMSRVMHERNWVFKTIGGTHPATQVTQNGYDPVGNLTSILDPLGRTTTQIFDARNRLKEVQDPFNGSASPTRYDYNGLDQVTQVIDPKGLATSYTLNGHGELLTQVSPDTGTTTFTYDPASNLKTKLDARGITATYGYDAVNRITSIVYPDETVTYTYDTCTHGIGRLCSIADGAGTTSYTYDVHGRVATKSQGVGGVTQGMAYGYNAAGQLVQVTTPSGQVVLYTYANNRPVSISVNATTILDSAMYEPFGPIGGWRWGNHTSSAPNYHTRVFDLDYRTTRVTSDLPATSGTELFDRGFSWDDAGRIGATTDYATSVLNGTYGYDALDRLTSAVQGSNTWGYTFDKVGNRLTSTVNTATTTYTYPMTSHRLTSLSGAQAKSYSYDAVGNTTSDGTATWTFGGNNRPTQVTVGSVATQFAINGLGQRVRKATGGAGTRFVYDEAGRLWGEYSDAGTLISETIWLEDLPVAVVRPATPSGVALYYVHADQLATPRMITRPSDNAAMWRWDNTEAFGNSAANDNLSGLGSFVFNQRFPGQYFDSETGLHYNYFREYDPSLGRYIESDPIGLEGGNNTYKYVNGNPLGLIDPEGLQTVVCLPPVCFPVPIPPPVPNGSSSNWDGSGSGSNVIPFPGRGSKSDPPICEPPDDDCSKAQRRLEATKTRVRFYLMIGRFGANAYRDAAMRLNVQISQHNALCPRNRVDQLDERLPLEPAK